MRFVFLYLSKIYGETFSISFLMGAVGKLAGSELAGNKQVYCWDRRNTCFITS